MNNISPEHSEVILRKMFKAVDEDYDSFDFKQDSWYWKNEWTQAQEDEFRVWLGKFLVKHKYAAKGKYRGQNAGYYKAGKLLMSYGWRIKYDK